MSLHNLVEACANQIQVVHSKIKEIQVPCQPCSEVYITILGGGYADNSTQLNKVNKVDRKEEY